MVIHAGALLPQIVHRWARLYADQKAVSAGVTYLHLLGILVGGGFALSADWATLRQPRRRGHSAEWSRELMILGPVHRWVIGGLGLSIVTGVFMMLADLPTYVPSILFWAKMGLVVLLIANGYVKLRAETALQLGGVSSWQRVRRTAAVSLVLWVVVLLAGSILPAMA